MATTKQDLHTALSASNLSEAQIELIIQLIKLIVENHLVERAVKFIVDLFKKDEK